jgi:ATP-binding cassette subfamily E protein 1
MRLAIVNKGKCKPATCSHECAKACPVNRKGEECILVNEKSVIDEGLCVGCGICIKRCPLGALDIINLPSVNEDSMVHRYGQNGFALYGLPVPKIGSVLGLLGRNGIGKSTAIEILSGKEKANFGGAEKKVEDAFGGSELVKYFETIKDKKVAYKPQNLSSLSVNVKVIDLLQERGEKKKIMELSERLGVDHLLENKLDKLSGGELQKVAIIAACLSEADIYFFDEPLAFLDIEERLRVSNFIQEISKDKTIIVVEHDLLVLDYLTEFLNIFYGQQGAYGLVSGVKSTSNGVNAYLDGFLREENIRIRDKELNFNFVKNDINAGKVLAKWPSFKKKLDKFELEVAGGEIKERGVVGILGKNGTGKTSFVNSLVEMDHGLEVSHKPQYLFTDSDELVRNVMIKEKINKQVASMFNLEVLSMKKVSELSGGELQRFSVARCLSKDADIYLIDEPSAYLDVEERISVAKAIKHLMFEKEKTAFVVDHDLLLMSYLADSLIVFSGESGKYGKSSEVMGFEKGISELMQKLDITLRKDKVSGRPRINKKGSVLDREQKASGDWVKF